MINSGHAFNTINKYSDIVNYYFYLIAIYKDLSKRNYLGYNFFKNLDNILNIGKSERKCVIKQFSYFFNAPCSEDVIKYVENLHHKDCIKSADYKVLFEGDLKYTTFVLVYFYDTIINNFYKFSSNKYKLFSVFKSKDKSDKDYYLLLGNINLEKNLDSPYNFGLDRFKRMFNLYKTYKYIPIGNYFILVKFSKANDYIRVVNEKKKGIKKPFPTNILKVKYVGSEIELEKNYNLVDVDFAII